MLDIPGNEPAIPKREKQEAKPFSIRLTQDEKQLLLHRAGRLPLGAYIRNLILADDVQAVRVRFRNPIKDHEALGRVLSGLGQSRMANNLNQLAKAVNIGTLPVTPETEQDIVSACSDVRAMRQNLVRALGLDDGGVS